MRRDRTVVDDPAAHGLLVLHDLEGLLRAQKRAVQDRVDDPLPALVGQLLDRPRSTKAGIVEQYVEPAVGLLGLGKQIADRFGIADIGRHAESATLLAFDFVDHRLQRLGPPAGDDDREPLLGESKCRGLADTAAAAGDEGDFTVRSHCADLLLQMPISHAHDISFSRVRSSAFRVIIRGGEDDMSDLIELNGRRYRKPQRPTVVICIDGCDPEYLELGIPDSVFPTIGSFRRTGFLDAADAAVPTFTNPNNVSIVTGAPPSVHGIAGNYYLDRETRRAIMMTDERLMRSETILALMARAGVRTAAITAKDKLRKLLGRNLDGICFSSECADVEVEAMVGRGKPDMYSADLSLFVLDAGIKLLERGAAELLYLSLSDYVQHAHAPGTPEADAFNRAIDDRVRRFVEIGAVVGLVADHGMNDKALPSGEPQVIFLEDELNDRFGDGTVRVICPITDPFVRHHGALGSFVRVYARDAGDIT